ncbi:MAG: hypothetical protein SGARI_003339 [Bacillariaceae sp.]
MTTPKQQNAQATATANRTLDYFLAHIPKAGGYYAYRMLNTFLNASPDIVEGMAKRRKLPKSEQYKVPVETFCNNGVQFYLDNFHNSLKGRNCTIQMDEVWPRKKIEGRKNGPLFPRSQIAHKYVIVRDPLSHVLSMFFHCTDHAGRAHLMPSMDEWLNSWANARGNQTKARQNQMYRCYEPIDFQANYLEFDPAKGQGKDFLKNSFDILGDFNRLQKSICAIFIKYKGEVPKECDCTDQGRRLGFERKGNEAHGVTHHGSSFNVTDEQRKLILEDIRPMDVKLYPIVQEVFQEQVEELEKEHNFVMCEKFRTVTD